MDVDYKQYIETLRIGLLGLNATNEVVSWNRWLEEKSNIFEKDIVGVNIFDVFPALKNTRVEQAIEACISFKQPAVISNIFVQSPFPLTNEKDVSERLKQQITILPINNAKNCQCLVQIVDVTPATIKVTALENQVQERKKAELAKANFLANMSHEIRTPMNGVLGLLELLNNDVLTPQQQHYALLAQSSAKSLLTLINDILDYSKINAGKLHIEKIDVDLHHLTDEVTDSMAIQAFEKGLQFYIDLSELSHHFVKTDPHRLRQILNNLISNAIKFTEHGHIKVSLRLDQNEKKQLLLAGSIEDSGIGIDENNMSKLFDSFTQADSTTTRKYGGTGLGLAIVKQLCELQGGNLKVNSTLHQGSTFSFSILVEHSILDKPYNINSAHKFGTIISIINNSIESTCLKNQFTAWSLNHLAFTTIDQAEPIIRDKLQTGNVTLFLNPQEESDQKFELIKRLKENFSDRIKTFIIPEPGEPLEAFKLKHPYIDETIEQPVTPFKLKFLFDNSQYPKELSTKKIVLPPTEKKETNENNKESLLLVEDNPVNQIVAQAMLEEMGYHIVLAENGEDALTVLKQHPVNYFSLILMDCQMPILDGYSTTKAIRAGDLGSRFNNMTIIAMTANAMKGDRQKCIDAGMNDYIAKPIEQNKLQNMLKKWTNHSTINR